MRRKALCTVIRHLLGRCSVCGWYGDHVHLVDSPLQLFCARCCIECGEAARATRAGAGAFSASEAVSLNTAAAAFLVCMPKFSKRNSGR